MISKILSSKSHVDCPSFNISFNEQNTHYTFITKNKDIFSRISSKIINTISDYKVLQLLLQNGSYIQMHIKSPYVNESVYAKMYDYSDLFCANDLIGVTDIIKFCGYNDVTYDLLLDANIIILCYDASLHRLNPMAYDSRDIFNRLSIFFNKLLLESNVVLSQINNESPIMELKNRNKSIPNCIFSAINITGVTN